MSTATKVIRRTSLQTTQELESLLDAGFGVADALTVIGLSYETVSRAVTRAGRVDLLGRLKRWKEFHADQVRVATGQYWSR